MNKQEILGKVTDRLVDIPIHYPIHYAVVNLAFMFAKLLFYLYLKENLSEREIDEICL